MNWAELFWTVTTYYNASREQSVCHSTANDDLLRISRKMGMFGTLPCNLMFLVGPSGLTELT